jgi:hypothetical protein
MTLMPSLGLIMYKLVLLTATSELTEALRTCKVLKINVSIVVYYM